MASKSTPNRREHERIDIEMPTRMWLDENYKGKDLTFEGFAETVNLSIGGTYVKSSYLLPMGFPLNLEMRLDDGELLDVRAEIIHRVSEPGVEVAGMGLLFTEVDAENRERLLRFFVSGRISDFYSDRFVPEFPHLEDVLSLADVALVINLWEDKEGRLTDLKRPEPKARKSKKR